MTACATCGSTSATHGCPACGPAATTTAAPTAAATATTAAPPAPAAAGYGSAKLVGDAAPFGGMPISRILNALCYVVTGIALFVVAGQGASQAWVAVLIGLAAVGYGLKILLTRSSYWITTIVYLAPVAAVAWAISAISG